MCTGVAGCFCEPTRVCPQPRFLSRISPAQLRRNATHRQSHA
ncbi:MAG: hypothetical protein ACI391_04335 [Muribaculaceae bacterium]